MQSSARYCRRNDSDVPGLVIKQRLSLGRTPLHIAAGSRTSPSLIKLLAYAHPAACDDTDNYGKTPLHYACDNSCVYCRLVCVAIWQIWIASNSSQLSTSTYHNVRTLSILLSWSNEIEISKRWKVWKDSEEDGRQETSTKEERERERIGWTDAKTFWYRKQEELQRERAWDRERYGGWLRVKRVSYVYVQCSIPINPSMIIDLSLTQSLPQDATIPK